MFDYYTLSRYFALQVCQSDRNLSGERDHRGAKSKERERSRDGELPSTVSQTVARDRAIQQKRREIDEVEHCPHTNKYTHQVIGDSCTDREKGEIREGGIRESLTREAS